MSKLETALLKVLEAISNEEGTLFERSWPGAGVTPEEAQLIEQAIAGNVEPSSVTRIENWPGETAPVRIRVRRAHHPDAMSDGCLLFDCSPIYLPVQVAEEIGRQLTNGNPRADAVGFALVNSKGEVLTTSWKGAKNGDEFEVITLAHGWTVSDLNTPESESNG